MRKILALSMITASVLALSACTRPSEIVDVDKNYLVSFGSMSGAYVGIFTDPETGCQSYVTSDGFMSPRLNPDGTQRCMIRSRSPAIQQ